MVDARDYEARRQALAQAIKVHEGDQYPTDQTASATVLATAGVFFDFLTGVTEQPEPDDGDDQEGPAEVSVLFNTYGDVGAARIKRGEFGAISRIPVSKLQIIYSGSRYTFGRGGYTIDAA